MTHAERLARLRLIRTPHVGPVSWHQLMQRFGSGEAALDALPDLVFRGGAGKVRIASADIAERELVRAADLGARHIFSDEPDYSPLLREGEIDLLGPTPVAVDELVRQSGQATATVQLVLLELELAGRIERHAGAKISLV
ncbi:MAG: hypothetical protein Q8Q79_10070 [Sphingopyxis sp.]|nr:hypothetical protein [Sphingopyxis sp.]